jgi:dihydropteroate synthase
MMGRRLETFHATLDAARARRGVALMGVCNVTPDSFSDGGRYFGVDAAIAHVDELLAEGADFIDVGGESTRPGALPVPPEEQIARVLGVVRAAAERGACVSIDTASEKVAAACLDAGACAVNDVSCLRDPGLARRAAGSGAALILMHSRGTQETMAGFSRYPDDAYGDVVTDVLREWGEAAGRAEAVGLPRDALIMDPGLGFAKNARHSLELLRRIDEIVARVPAGTPVAVGASRKSFLTVVDRDAPPSERIGASIEAALHAADGCTSILRVHDVKATAQAIDLRLRLRASEHARAQAPARAPGNP